MQIVQVHNLWVLRRMIVKSFKFEGNKKSNVIVLLLILAVLVLVWPWGSAFGQAITGTLLGTDR